MRQTRLKGRVFVNIYHPAWAGVKSTSLTDPARSEDNGLGTWFFLHKYTERWTGNCEDILLETFPSLSGQELRQRQGQLFPTASLCTPRVSHGPNEPYFLLLYTTSTARLKGNTGSYTVCLSTAEEDQGTWDRHRPEGYEGPGHPGAALHKWAALAGRTHTSSDADRHQHRGFAVQTPTFTYFSW